ncbi:Calponin homology domain [Trypanosoma melophagium]|uniref:Calponin homology domain n=1 Tax=Trypanosoma melophagium TaxID=715481 RepID=UPI00351A1A37|nr:Calponin homology domain [Trypanosoma melophagium]
MSAVSFTESDKNDLREFYRIYDFAKVKNVDHTVETCIERGITPQQLFDDLYNLHHVKKLPDRVAAAQRLRTAIPTATVSDVESVLRYSEMTQLTECDALRALRRRMGVKSHTSGVDAPSLSSSLAIGSTAEKQEKTTSTSMQPNIPLKAINNTSISINTANTTVNTSAVIDNGGENGGGRVKQLNAGPTRAVMDEIMTAECRDWVAQVVGDAYNADVLHAENFVDSLRSGVVLLVLLQKLRDPPVANNALKIPKRSTGFFARDNVASFLKEARCTYDLVEAQLFTDSDLCDGKNDRAVITCLLSIARIAYARGSTTLAPAMIMYEQEIDAKMKNVTQQQIDDVVLEAEASEINSEVLDEAESEKEKENNNSNNGGEENENIELDHVINSLSKETPAERLTSLKAPDDMATKEEKEKDENEKEEKEEEEVEEKDENEKEEKEEEEVEEKDENEKETGMTITEMTNTSAEKSDDTNISLPPHIDKSQDQSDDTSPLERQVDKRKKEETSGEKKTGRVFYLRGGSIGEDIQKLPTSPPKSIQSKLISQSTAASRTTTNTIPTSTERQTTSQEAPKYRPRRWDEIDTALSIIVNAYFSQHPLSHIRFRRLSSTAGEYVVYHRIKGHKRLLYARIIQGRLMIRPTANNSGGAPTWMDLQQWFDRYEKELEEKE